jgi:hypothetical protein
MNINKIRYVDKIYAISMYFGVSSDAAKYMYDRRRLGVPYRNNTDDLFLEWNTKIQNALVKADSIDGFDWNKLNYYDDIDMLALNGIVVEDQPIKIQIKKKIPLNTNILDNLDNSKPILNGYFDFDSNKDDGWTLITSERNQMTRRKILKRIGFLHK